MYEVVVYLGPPVSSAVWCERAAAAAAVLVHCLPSNKKKPHKKLILRNLGKIRNLRAVVLNLVWNTPFLEYEIQPAPVTRVLSKGAVR